MTVPTPQTGSTILAYIPSPPAGVWYLGPLPLRAYALCIIAGIIIAVWWGNRRWKARGGQEGEVLDVAIWAVPFGLVGGRLYHLATDWRTYFGDGPKDPIDALKIWDGGLGIWGAVLLGAVGAWIGARRHGIKLPPFGDALAPPILLAQAIGRLGNYFNQELYGRETTVPWGLKIYERVDSDGFADPGLITGSSNGTVVAIVHPTFLYELLWNMLVVILLVVADRRFRIGHGRLFALYVAGYCVGRFGVELMRSDPATHIFGTRINVFTAIVVFACAAAYFVLAPKGREQGLSIYHHARAEELEELGELGYVDDRFDADADRADADRDTNRDMERDDARGRDEGAGTTTDSVPESEPAVGSASVPSSHSADGDAPDTGSVAQAALAAAIARHTPRTDDGEPVSSDASGEAWVLESDDEPADGIPDPAESTDDPAAEGTDPPAAENTDSPVDGNPDLAHGNPDLAHGNPDLADDNPDLADDNPEPEPADGIPESAEGTDDPAEGTDDPADDK
ncbi:prolipoprotein diacylglyceryl transferase [Gordonia sp. ABSL11-1]|uniref:prolipoprotein diacylglyceryl transferase n=1 Tax=Gordonia sp. ABSL11-1 TaxID=3053924 RepID=UPI002572B84C|nr:prolipoprotein diacylglyceryl transferase [Gordonia sp. ABSL11-1]MDL9944484.1 prolipoprotein diacylglyceryl transferase [Gordonia sp. ABSL11-1]